MVVSLYLLYYLQKEGSFALRKETITLSTNVVGVRDDRRQDIWQKTLAENKHL